MINFCASLKADKSLYKNLKMTNPQELMEKTQNFISLPIFDVLLPEDEIVLSAKKSKTKDELVVKTKNEEFEIQSKNPITPSHLAYHLMIYTIGVNKGRVPYSTTFKKLADELVRLAKLKKEKSEDV